MNWGDPISAAVYPEDVVTMIFCSVSWVVLCILRCGRLQAACDGSMDNRVDAVMVGLVDVPETIASIEEWSGFSL